jgi:hypothetical protein
MSSGWLPKHRQLLFQIFEEGPKVPAPPDPYDLQRKSSFYLDERNGQMRAKRLAAEIELALTRGRLIEKRLVEWQLAYLLVSIRQKLLAIPAKLYSGLGKERFPREVAQECETFIHEVLNELSKLPECAEPNWLHRLKEEK